MAYARRGTQQVSGVTTVSAGSMTLSLPGALTAGDFIAVGAGETDGVPKINAITDNQTGNTYNRQAIGSGVNGANTKVAIFSSPNINGSGTLTLTFTALGTADLAMAISEYSGSPATDPIDKTAAGGSNVATNSETTATTAALTQQNELGIAFLTHDNSAETWTVNAPYTKVTDTGASGAASVSICMADNIISNGAAQTCTTTTNNVSNTYDACIATFLSVVAPAGQIFDEDAGWIMISRPA